MNTYEREPCNGRTSHLGCNVFTETTEKSDTLWNIEKVPNENALSFFIIVPQQNLLSFMAAEHHHYSTNPKPFSYLYWTNILYTKFSLASFLFWDTVSFFKRKKCKVMFQKYNFLEKTQLFQQTTIPCFLKTLCWQQVRFWLWNMRW